MSDDPIKDAFDTLLYAVENADEHASNHGWGSISWDVVYDIASDFCDVYENAQQPPAEVPEWAGSLGKRLRADQSSESEPQCPSCHGTGSTWDGYALHTKCGCGASQSVAAAEPAAVEAGPCLGDGHLLTPKAGWWLPECDKTHNGDAGYWFFAHDYNAIVHRVNNWDDLRAALATEREQHAKARAERDEARRERDDYLNELSIVLERAEASDAQRILHEQGYEDEVALCNRLLEKVTSLEAENKAHNEAATAAEKDRDEARQEAMSAKKRMNARTTPNLTK